MRHYNEKVDFVIRSVLSRMNTMLPENVLTELCVEIEAFIENMIREMPISDPEPTDEAAIAHLQRSGWMARHDREMSSNSLTALVNGLMLDGNKSISINVYPYKEDENA